MDEHKVASESILKGIGGIGETFTDKYKTEQEKNAAMAELYGSRAEAEKAKLANSGYVPNIGSRFALAPGATPFKSGAPTYYAPNTGLINSRA